MFVSLIMLSLFHSNTFLTDILVADVTNLFSGPDREVGFQHDKSLTLLTCRLGCLAARGIIQVDCKGPDFLFCV
jgi:hypothetical protein